MSFNIINNRDSVGGNRGVLRSASELQAAGTPFALALVVHTVGSTYRKPGALALYANDESTKGVISGGCFESNWHKVAQDVLSTQQSKFLLLDTQLDDDLIFGSGSGCRGTMHILVIPVIGNQQNALYAAIVESSVANRELTLALLTDTNHCAMGIGWCGDARYSFGTLSDTLNSLRDAAYGLHHINLSNGEAVVASVFSIAPPPQVLLIGASVESPFLISIAQSLGWKITIVDHRPAQLDQVKTMADHVIADRPAAALSKHTRLDAVLVMSHSAVTDLEALQTLAHRADHYVGLLGPPSRRDELLSQLTEAQRVSLLPRLHAPMGMRLGGHGPEPLALSIVAELQQFFNLDKHGHHHAI